MRIGDEGYLKYPFTVYAYDLDKELLHLYVHISKIKEKEVTLPLYISNLGLYLPEFDYCIPGDYLPLEHPDYYEVLDLKNGMKVMYEDRRCKLVMAPDFNVTGKYSIWVEEDYCVTKKASLKGVKERQEMLEENILNQKWDGNVIQGRIILFYLGNENKIFPSYIMGPNIAESAYTVLQDSITLVEMSIPSDLIATK